jgi:dTDP-4-amino-4,6-dideoxygalactose transaminase
MIGLLPTVAQALYIPEREFRDPAGEPGAKDANCYFVKSGTAALALAVLDAIGAKTGPGKAQVILPAYCCPDVLSAVHFAGAEPVLVDFEPNSTQMNLESVRAAMSERTAAVIAVNFLGIAERLQALADIVTGHECAIIDDSCQNMPPTLQADPGATCKILSFGRGKPVNLLHGGALISRKPLAPAVAQTIGSATGSNSAASHWLRMAAFNSARAPLLFSLVNKLGLAGATRYRALTDVRLMNGYTQQALPAAFVRHGQSDETASQEIATRLEGTQEYLIDLPRALSAHVNGRLLRYPVLAASRQARDRLITQLRGAGVCVSAMYGVPLPDIEGSNLPVLSSGYPNAVDFSQKLLTIPVHSGITSAIIDRITTILASDPANL